MREDSGHHTDKTDYQKWLELGECDLGWSWCRALPE